MSAARNVGHTLDIGYKHVIVDRIPWFLLIFSNFYPLFATTLRMAWPVFRLLYLFGSLPTGCCAPLNPSAAPTRRLRGDHPLQLHGRHHHRRQR